VYTSNVHTLAAVDTLGENAADITGLRLLYGAAGSGKTWAVRHVARKFDAVFCTALPFGTQHVMLTALTRAIDEPPLGRRAEPYTRRRNHTTASGDNKTAFEQTPLTLREYRERPGAPAVRTTSSRTAAANIAEAITVSRRVA
jgi:hypothetical protein